MIAAIEFKIDDKREAILYLAGSYNYIDWNSGGKTKLGDDIRAFSYKQGQKGVPAKPDFMILRLEIFLSQRRLFRNYLDS